MQSTIMMVVEAYRLDRYDNCKTSFLDFRLIRVVEAYRLDRYDNYKVLVVLFPALVVEAYRLDRYDNKLGIRSCLRFYAL